MKAVQSVITLNVVPYLKMHRIVKHIWEGEGRKKGKDRGLNIIYWRGGNTLNKLYSFLKCKTEINIIFVKTTDTT